MPEEFEEITPSTGETPEGSEVPTPKVKKEEVPEKVEETKEDKTSETVSSLREEINNLSEQLSQAGEKQKLSSEEIGEMQVKLTRNQILLENPDIASKISDFLKVNPWGIWGTEEEMRKQVNEFREMLKLEEVSKKEEVVGTTPPVPPSSGPKAPEEITPEEAWETPLEELKETIKSIPGVKHIK